MYAPRYGAIINALFHKKNAGQAGVGQVESWIAKDMWGLNQVRIISKVLPSVDKDTIHMAAEHLSAGEGDLSFLV